MPIKRFHNYDGALGGVAWYSGSKWRRGQDSNLQALIGRWFSRPLRYQLRYPSDWRKLTDSIWPGLRAVKGDRTPGGTRRGFYVVPLAADGVLLATFWAPRLVP